MSKKFSNWTYIGSKFKFDEDLLSKIKDAKKYLEPAHERAVRELQLTTHGAKCNNHTP